MDPISTAIVAAVAKLSEPAIRDAYDGLKAIIARKFGREHSVTKAIEDVEANPKSDGRKVVLSEEVTSANPGADADVMAAVQQLLDRLEKSGVPTASMRVEAKGERSVAIGGGVSGSTIRTGDETSGGGKRSK